MIKINMFSKADTVQGQGVGSAYNELIGLLRKNLSNEFQVTINQYSQSDITHYHTINPTYFINSFSKNRGRKIGYVHFLPETLEGSIKLPSGAKTVLYKYVIDFYKRMDQIVVVNPIFIDKLANYGIDRSKIKYIPNFVSKSVFYEQTDAQKKQFREKVGIPDDKFVIFGDGQVQVRKGVDDFAKLAQANPDIQFIWAGGFSFGKMTEGYDRLKKLVANPPKNLLFTGIITRQELVNYLNIANLFLLPSYDELFPMSVLEAFSCGTPVLLRNLDLYKAIIDGYYMSGNNFDDFNQIIQSVLSDPEKLKRYHTLSLKASDEYSEANLTKVWREFYLEQYNLGKKMGQIK